eukprot:sb/3474202/
MTIPTSCTCSGNYVTRLVSIYMRPSSTHVAPGRRPGAATRGRVAVERSEVARCTVCSIGLTRSPQELWSEHWPDRNLYVTITPGIDITRTELNRERERERESTGTFTEYCRQGTAASFIFKGECTGGKGSSNSMATFPAY